jgi:hypothetical protein
MIRTFDVSLSGSYIFRWYGVSYVNDGQQADPRQFYAPFFQLVAPDSDTFGTWQAGAWEAFANPTGPYAARVVIGAGQPVQLNPGVEGNFDLWVQLQPNGTAVVMELPEFRRAVFRFTAP